MADLEALAGQLRERIIGVTQKNGGHLASNLGVVELTIALHRAFRIPRDRIVFDVSHQCYAHKLLSGRDGPAFDRLRQWGGLSGFCDRAESPADTFTSGHAGTALSSALGMAVARDLRGEDFHVVALIGDASLSCGLTMEALQHVRDQTRRLIIVLNDNGHAIDGSVGAWAEQLRRLAGGNGQANPFAHGYGLGYIGPVAGHDFTALEEALAAAKRAQFPVLVHVCTQKGRGYSAAADCPTRFHGIFPAEATRRCGASTAFGEVLGQTLCELAASDPRIVAISAAMTRGTGLEPFAARFPERFFDVGIAEGHAITFAAGLAAASLRPVCAIYSPFAQRAVDNFFHDVCLQNLPVVLCMDRAGLSCSDGDTHHGLFDIALFSPFPNIAFAQPSSPEELRKMLPLALETERPFLIRYEKGPISAADGEKSTPIGLGRARRVRDGSGISIWSLGHRRLGQALELAERLEALEIFPELIDARFIHPLDEEQLAHSARCDLIVTLEDHVGPGGFGSLVAGKLQAMGRTTPLLSQVWPFPVGFAENSTLLEAHRGQATEAIFQKILARLPNAPPLKNPGGRC